MRLCHSSLCRSILVLMVLIPVGRGGRLLGQSSAGVEDSGSPSVESGSATGDREAADSAFPRSSEVPDHLLAPPRRQPIILPAAPRELGQDPVDRSIGVVGQVSPGSRLLPEGYIVAGRTARLSAEPPWLLAYVEDQPEVPAPPPLRILPNHYLALAETVLAAAPQAGQFVITGRVTEFQGRNYILLEDLVQLAPSESGPSQGPNAATAKPAPATPDNASDAAGDSASPSEPDASSQAATESQPAEEPSAEDVLRQMMAAEPPRALVLPTLPADSPATVEPAEPSPADATASDTPDANQPRWAETTLLVDRLGRIVPRDEWWWALAFEDRGSEANVKPLRLLPNRLLETAMASSGTGRQGAVLTVSGEITTYRQENYLLLRKVIVRRDLGNLR